MHQCDPVQQQQKRDSCCSFAEMNHAVHIFSELQTWNCARRTSFIYVLCRWLSTWWLLIVWTSWIADAQMLALPVTKCTRIHGTANHTSFWITECIKKKKAVFKMCKIGEPKLGNNIDHLTKECKRCTEDLIVFWCMKQIMMLFMKLLNSLWHWRTAWNFIVHTPV